MAYHGVVGGVDITTSTMCWGVFQLPIVAQAYRITEFTFVEKKPCSDNGSAISHEEAPFWLVRSTLRF